jgi:hypothetical protein
MKKINKPTLHVGDKIAVCEREIKLPNLLMMEGMEQSVYELYAEENNLKFCQICRTILFTGKFSFLNRMDAHTSVVIPAEFERSLSTTISAKKKKSNKIFEIEKEGDNYRVWRRK